MSMYDWVEKRSIRRSKERNEKTQAFADYICTLFDDVEQTYGNIGEITLRKKDCKYLGKREVPCFYHVTDEQIALILDYSFITSPWAKSFEDTGLSFKELRNALSDKGIKVTRETGHPEYEIESDLRGKDLLIFQMNRIKEKKPALRSRERHSA